ncbi:type II secretion system protein GspM [uncultured Intestinimonas sp.]|uniref:type II secretion system protein GspM n=1 Tax=uncultured Intestinimonas sp. TaxID=1689265 RepID=UPI0025E3E43F|nr:type II secretion system protein GspM [uncultured Intestinimonas sp.]
MRNLTVRERVLLLLLAVIAVISGYVLLFYMPTTQRIESLNAQIAQSQELVAQMDARLATQQQMERKLEQLSAQGAQVPYMPAYDNLQAVMVELNTILAGCQEYSLSFQSEQGEDNVFCRQVSIPFTCGSYEQAHEILQKLHDSALRGLLGDMQLSQQENGTVKVSVIITFFEYQTAGSAQNQEEVELH